MLQIAYGELHVERSKGGLWPTASNELNLATAMSELMGELEGPWDPSTASILIAARQYPELHPGS